MKCTSGRIRTIILSLALMLLFGIVPSEVSADDRPINPEIGPNTHAILFQQESGYKYQIIPLNETPPPGFEQPGFDDTAWNTGSAAFGSRGMCPLQENVQTSWPVNTQLLVRRAIYVPAGWDTIRVLVSIDDEIVGVFFNGTPIAGLISHDGCPIQDEFRFDVPQSLVQPGENFIAFHLLDRGTESFFDARILADSSTTADEIVIDFDDPSALAEGFESYQATFADDYVEDGMRFTYGVYPPNPLWQPSDHGHYHLIYEDDTVDITCNGRTFSEFGRCTPDGFVPVIPENEPRFLTPMVPGDMIQLTYDPDIDGEPDPFDLVRLTVHQNRLNLWTESPITGIRLYPDLRGGHTYLLRGADVLTRAILEYSIELPGGEGFEVDDIVIKTAGAQVIPRELISFQIINVLSGSPSPSLLDLLHQVVFAVLSNEKAQVKLRGPGKDQFEVQGNLTPGAESDGFDVPNEEVSVTFDGFSQTIPAGRFSCDTSGKLCYYMGTSGGIKTLKIAIVDDKLWFRAWAVGVDLTRIDLDNPVPFSLQIGDDLSMAGIRINP